MPPLDLVTLSHNEQARVLAFVSLNSLLMLAHASSTYSDIVREVSERGCHWSRGSFAAAAADAAAAAAAAAVPAASHRDGQAAPPPLTLHPPPAARHRSTCSCRIAGSKPARWWNVSSR